jgi:hypothetical protein
VGSDTFWRILIPWTRIFGRELTASVPALLNLTRGKSFLLGDAYPMACIPSLAAASGRDGTDSILKYIVSDASGLLRLCPFVPDS